ncbi:hypothetical protein FN976_21315 [Caenimonas sedimenti]|uniref:Uncharacterized protein n=1 Tax=Caenimonas sedimenti TaxID=2596921 RepID=A0A562ZKS1_9BURK|nr:hypothetical protein FN976_21315 [Caenimonas sedimenti]
MLEAADMLQWMRERSGFYPNSSLGQDLKLAFANILGVPGVTKFFEAMSFFDPWPEEKPQTPLGAWGFRPFAAESA